MERRTLSTAVLALLLLAVFSRNEPGVAGPGGVLRPSALAAVLVVCAALVGAATVKLGLNAFVVASHLAIAMSLLAVLSIVVSRDPAVLAQRRHERRDTSYVARRIDCCRACVFHVDPWRADGKSSRCCHGVRRVSVVPVGAGTETGLAIQITHRVVAFLLFGHLWGVAAALPKRREPRVVVLAARIAFGATILQVLIAAAMVEMDLPMVLRSLHQAVGTFVWLVDRLNVFAGLARIASPAAATEKRVLSPATSMTSIAATTQNTLVQDMVMLTKPRIISLLLVTTVAPMYVAGTPASDLVLVVMSVAT